MLLDFEDILLGAASLPKRFLNLLPLGALLGMLIVNWFFVKKNRGMAV